MEWQDYKNILQIFAGEDCYIFLPKRTITISLGVHIRVKKEIIMLSYYSCAVKRPLYII
jgi:hypothetical protein